MGMRFSIAAAGCLVSLLSLAQNPPVIVWQTSHGGSWDDQGFAIVESDNGSYIVAGETYSEDFDIVGHHGSPGSPDALVLKYDTDGNLLWQRSLGGTSGEIAFDMVATANGGCVIACSAASTNGDVIGVTGDSDFWLVGLDGDGEILWQRVLGGSGSDWYVYMDATSDGGTVLCGETSSSDGDVSFNHGGSDLWVVKLDPVGTIEWEKSFGGSLAEHASGIIQNSAGGYYVIGSTTSNDGDVAGNHGGVYDAWVFRLDDLGNMLWQKTMGGSDRDLFSGLTENNDGGVTCVASSSSTDGDMAGNFGSGDLWLVNLDSSGTVQWQHNYGYAWNDGGRCIKKSATGGYFIAGYTYGPNGNDGGLWILEVDSVGIIKWDKSIGGRGGEEAIDMIVDSNNDIVLTGWATSGDGDLSENHGLPDVWTVKLTLDYATMTGRAFVDTDNDGEQNGPEIGMANHAIQNLGSGLPYYTDASGDYSVVAVDTGTTTIEPMAAPHHAFAPLSHSATFPTLAQQNDTANDFALQSSGTFNDLDISLTPVGVFRHLHPVHYTISYINVGTTVAEPVVRFFVDPALTYLSASITPNSINMDTLIWLLPAIGPYGTGTIDVFVSVPLSTPLGSTLSCAAFIGPLVGDANPDDNVADWDVIATGSADPNDIQVDRSTLEFNELNPTPPYLDYLIRFQNIGNDTAFAVHIENALPANADLGSFQIVSSSHPVQVAYLHHVDRFNFTFNNILLPDSNTNETGSHGFIRYRIRPNNYLLVGDSVLNSAGIYFDHNAPVPTNTAYTVIAHTTGLSVIIPTGMTISPNPSNGHFRVQAGNERSGSITIADATGKVFQRVPYTGPRSVDLSGAAPGLYFISLVTPDRVATGKVVIEQ